MKSATSANQTRFPAPALERGLRVLRMLNVEGALSLDALAHQTQVPKASLLRLLETLEKLDLVVRDPVSRNYRAQARIVPSHDAAQRLRPQLRSCLKLLCAGTGCTAEWYEPELGQVVITDRQEPVDATVCAKARVGFPRELDGELEAVARVALAAGVPCPTVPAYWQYDDQGKHRKLSAVAASKQIRAAETELYAADTLWNNNGVRRFAIGLTNASGLVGLLALAQTFSPRADQQAEDFRNRLQSAVETLSPYINERTD